LDLQTELNIMELYQQGYNDYQIAEKLGMWQSKVCIFRNQQGLKPNGINIVNKERMKLYEQGLTCKEMSERLGVPESTIRPWLRRMGLSANKVNEKGSSLLIQTTKRDQSDFYDKIPKRELIIMGNVIQLLRRAKELNNGKLDVDDITVVLREINKGDLAVEREAI